MWDIEKGRHHIEKGRSHIEKGMWDIGFGGCTHVYEGVEEVQDKSGWHLWAGIVERRTAVHDFKLLTSGASERAKTIFDRYAHDAYRINCNFVVVREDLVMGSWTTRWLSQEVKNAIVEARHDPVEVSEVGFRRLRDIEETRIYVHRPTKYSDGIVLMPAVAISKHAHDARRANTDDDHDIFALTLKGLLQGMRDGFMNEEAEKNFFEYDHASFQRWAATRLMRRASWTANRPSFSSEFYDAINDIALSPYEGKSAEGTILIRNLNTHSCAIKLAKPTPLNERQKARKLLAACSAEFSAVTDGASIHGYDRDAARSGFYIEFLGRQDWCLMHGNERLMLVVRGLPEFPRAGTPTAQLKATLERIFGDQGLNYLQALQKLVDTAAASKQGSVFIVLETPEKCIDEAERLGATKVDPFELGNIETKHLARIDGALIVDLSGHCYAIGAILDGRAISDKQDAARGSRYNSALRYVHVQKRALAIVTSEDGGVEFLSA